MPKPERKKKKVARHDPLAQQLRDEQVLRESGPDEDGESVGETGAAARRRPISGRKAAEDETSEIFVSEKLTQRILDQARDQRLEEELGLRREADPEGLFPSDAGLGPVRRSFRADASDSESVFSEDEEHYLDDTELSPADARVLAMFSAPGRAETRNLADIIAAKLREKEQNILLAPEQVQERVEDRLGEKVVRAYRIVAQTLRTYRSGKLPKAFKIIPSLENWEDIVYLCEPPTWTAQAMYQATRVFASNLNADMAQRFFSLVLLPCVREDIAEHGKLNYHLYQALKKALYKPGAFYKGFLIPLVEEGSCSLREAMIIAAVLRKGRIPVLHSAAAMVRLCEFGYTGAITILLRVLIDKKYALPLRVIDSLVGHFTGFAEVPEAMPVIWHLSLLSFCQRYKADLQDFQREQLKALMHAQFHHAITPEIRRELFATEAGLCEVVDESAARAAAPMAIAAARPLTAAATPKFATSLMRTMGGRA